MLILVHRNSYPFLYRHSFAATRTYVLNLISFLNIKLGRSPCYRHIFTHIHVQSICNPFSVTHLRRSIPTVPKSITDEIGTKSKFTKTGSLYHWSKLCKIFDPRLLLVFLIYIIFLLLHRYEHIHFQNSLLGFAVRNIYPPPPSPPSSPPAGRNDVLSKLI